MEMGGGDYTGMTFSAVDQFFLKTKNCFFPKKVHMGRGRFGVGIGVKSWAC